ncbi:hypothetical protein FACS1894172_10910 [Spirochaetia bacterium]|nr:hypothetical protein FACS1894164_20940 [Spirochaetia bacterium]GHU33084.1 hypothetical protein FACS1894172_10910 [Spirochaetia bacterium]
MKQDLTEIVAILDKSGSMSPLTDDTIGGYNEFIEEQKKLQGEAVLTTVFFNHEYQLVHNGKDIKKIKKITRKDYTAGGNTALLDALGKTINDIVLKLHNTQEESRPGKVIFFIITDGYENSSKEFSQEKIREMVELQKSTYNWEFIFMGANIDAFSTAGAIGISQDRAFNYSVQHISNAQKAMSVAVKNFRKTGNVDKGEDFRKEIE